MELNQSDAPRIKMLIDQYLRNNPNPIIMQELIRELCGYIMTLLGTADRMADALKETRVLGQSEDWFVTALEAVRDYKDIAEEPHANL